MVIVALLCMFSCTTEVDICKDSSHLHLAEVELVHDISNVPDADKVKLPDSMIVVAYRVVNSWKCTYMSPYSEDYKPGRFIYNNPVVEQDGDAAKRNAVSKSPAATETPGSEKFLVKRGDYRFLAFNNILNDVMFSHKAEDHWFETQVGLDSVMLHKEYVLHYKNYNLASEHVEKFNKVWDDYNRYSTYISSSHTPIISCYSDLYHIDDKGNNKVELNYNEVSQTIEIHVSIAHELIDIKDVIAEISGIPCGINLMTGELDISDTYKTLFRMEENKNSDGGNSKNITSYVGSINVMGLVSNNSKEQYTGPGILQLAIHTFDNKLNGERIFHVGINLYNTINKYSRVIGGYDDKVVLEVDGLLDLNADFDEKPNDDTAVDKWIIFDDDIHIDI